MLEKSVNNLNCGKFKGHNSDEKSVRQNETKT